MLPQKQCTYEFNYKGIDDGIWSLLLLLLLLLLVYSLWAGLSRDQSSVR